MNCKYCNRYCKNKNSLIQHEIRCHDNPNRLTNCGNHGNTKGHRGGNQYTKAKELGLPKPQISDITRCKLIQAAIKRHNIIQAAKQKGLPNPFITDECRQKMSEGGRKSCSKQNRRSRNEIYFYNLCNQYFKHVDNNKLIFNGWDADIIIYDIKYAVHWNGIWHYKQIYKNQSLKQVQSRDKIKYQIIESLNWTNYIIKDMGKYNKEFVENEFNKFIKYLQLNNISINKY